MSLRRMGLLLVLPAVVGLSLSACGDDDNGGSVDAGGGGMSSAGKGGKGGAGGKAGSSGKGGTGAGDEGGETNIGGSDVGGAPDNSAGAGNMGNVGDEGGADMGGAPNIGAGGSGGEAGQASVACHADSFNFNTDPGGSLGIYVASGSGPVQSSTVQYSATEGSTAAGSGQLNATFGALGEQAQLNLYVGHSAWTCVTKVHAMVKLTSATATDLSYVSGIALSINSTTTTGSQFTGGGNNTTGWVLDTWYPIVLTFATAFEYPSGGAPNFADVNSLGVQLQTVSSGTTPVPTTMYVDDVWAE